jgi:hypothetical protein
MNRKIFLILILAISLSGSAAFADTLTGTTGVWLQSGVWVPNENNYPYWDHTSWDGSQRNVGFYLMKTGAFASNPNSPDLTANAQSFYINNGNGSADPNVYFQGSGTGNNAFQMFIEVAGLKSQNSFGWYDTNATGTLHEIFAGGVNAPPLQSATVSISATSYGFYMKNSSNTWYTQASLQTGSSSDQHFAFFQDPAKYPGTFFIGVEDLPFCNTDRDYNDMIISTRAMPIPLPPTLLLFGTGLLGLGWMKGRRKSG